MDRCLTVWSILHLNSVRLDRSYYGNKEKHFELKVKFRFKGSTKKAEFVICNFSLDLKVWSSNGSYFQHNFLNILLYFELKSVHYLTFIKYLFTFLIFLLSMNFIYFEDHAVISNIICVVA